MSQSFFYPGKQLTATDETLERAAIENLPIKHVSPSCLRAYLTDRQSFFRRYIRMEFDTKGGAAMVEGSAFHKFFELLALDAIAMKPANLDEYLNAAISLMHAEDAEGKIEWGATGSLEKSIATVKQSIDFYLAEIAANPKSFNPIAAEHKIVSEFADENGEIMPLPIKTFSDRIDGDDEEIDIVDYKLVSTLCDPTEPQPAFEIQAALNFFNVRSDFKKPPRRMRFIQVKKTKNRDGSPQVVEYVIDFFDANGNPHPCLKRAVELYRRMLCEIAGMPLIDADTGVVRFLPNPFAAFGWKESWLDFCDEVDNGTTWNREMIRTIQANAYADDGVEAADI